MYDFDFDMLISWWLAPSRGRGGRQRDGERITAHHHEGDQPSDRSLTPCSCRRAQRPWPPRNFDMASPAVKRRAPSWHLRDSRPPLPRGDRERPRLPLDRPPTAASTAGPSRRHHLPAHLFPPALLL